jgi:site-specific DNA-methyltransferase (adenine-specific)
MLDHTGGNMTEKVTIGNVELWHGDCLELMQSIPDGSVDMILCDLPYGTTACKWDSVIPFEPLWAQYRRIAKRNAAIVLTASQPFTTTLISSNIECFKYCWIWDKTSVGNPQLAKIQPLKSHEDICVFSSCGGRVTYHPQGIKRCEIVRKKDHSALGHCVRKDYVQEFTNYPKSIITVRAERGYHPTQKPVALMEYLIRTYTNEGETVLDNCMGSGTTGVACANTGRRFIGIERERKYFDIACERIENAQRQRRLSV